MTKITVVGSFAVGLTIRSDTMPVFGETLRGRDFDFGPGGKGSNQAVGTARLGATSALVTYLGEDQLAGVADELYAAEGVDTTYIRRTAQKATGAGIIVLNAEGENFIILDMGANDLMDAEFVDGAYEGIRDSDIVMAVLEIPVPAAMRAMQLGKTSGAKTILNPGPGHSAARRDVWPCRLPDPERDRAADPDGPVPRRSDANPRAGAAPGAAGAWAR